MKNDTSLMYDVVNDLFHVIHYGIYLSFLHEKLLYMYK